MAGGTYGSRAGIAPPSIVRRVMTADVAQAVDLLGKALLEVDRLDQEKTRPHLVETHAAEIRRRLTNARAVLARRRAELDAILLGDEVDG